MVSEIDLEPRLFDFVPREAQLTSAPSRSAPTDRPLAGSVSYLLLFALIGAAIIGIFFGLAFAVLTPPNDHTVVAAGPVSSGEEEAVRTAKATPSPGDPPATIVTSAPVQDPTSHMPDSPASPPQVNSSAAAAEFARALARQRGAQAAVVEAALIRQLAAASRLTTIGNPRRKPRSSGYCQPRWTARTVKTPLITSRPSRSESRGEGIPFELLITNLTGPTKSALSLTPPRAEQPQIGRRQAHLVGR